MDAHTIEKSLYAQILCGAISNKQRIIFYYHEKERIGEPQCCGVSTAEKEVVRVHLLKGGSRPEQLFEVGRINSLEVLNEFFSKPGPNYKENDMAMKVIHCQL
jgi:hypothetical protein